MNKAEPSSADGRGEGATQYHESFLSYLFTLGLQTFPGLKCATWRCLCLRFHQHPPPWRVSSFPRARLGGWGTGDFSGGTHTSVDISRSNPRAMCPRPNPQILCIGYLM